MSKKKLSTQTSERLQEHCTIPREKLYTHIILYLEETTFVVSLAVALT